MNPELHEFTIVIGRWEHQSRDFTLRLCQKCGLTHRLVWYTRPPKWVWELVPEETQPYFRESGSQGEKTTDSDEETS